MTAFPNFVLFIDKEVLEMANPKDKEFSTNPEVKRADDFQKGVDVKETVIELAKELLVSTTEDAFSKMGYDKVEKKAGFYGTGKSYGTGTEENKFSVRVAGVTKSSLEKQVMLGTKRIQSDIKFQYNGTMVNVEYKTTEAGFFRGVDNKSIPYSFTKTITADGTKKTELQKAMKELFEEAAKKEVGYLTNTKLGVDDKIDKGTTSTVNENTKPMTKLTLKSIFSIDEDLFKSLNESKKPEENIKQVKNANTVPIANVNKNKENNKSEKGKFLLFDKTEKELQERAEKSEVGKDEYLQMVRTEMKKKFGTDKLAELTPVEKKEFFNHIDNIYVSKDEKAQVNEDGGAGVTSTGPGGSGAGAFLSPYAFKSTAYAKGKNHKRPTVTQEYKVVPNSEGYNSDGFWKTVDTKALQGTHPLGMPGIKPNSKAEVNATLKGDKNKLKRLGLNESTEKTIESPKLKLDLTKKKIFCESENKEKGINKRYLVTEKTSEEYLKDRWKKLTSFKLNESINENLEINDLLSECECQNKPVLSFNPIDSGAEDINLDTEMELDNPVELTAENLEETVTVQKPGSLFGTEYIFYKKDFVNESKKYILDLNSKVFVPNPNTK